MYLYIPTRWHQLVKSSTAWWVNFSEDAVELFFLALCFYVKFSSKFCYHLMNTEQIRFLPELYDCYSTCYCQPMLSCYPCRQFGTHNPTMTWRAPCHLCSVAASNMPHGSRQECYGCWYWQQQNTNKIQTTVIVSTFSRQNVYQQGYPTIQVNFTLKNPHYCKRDNHQYKSKHVNEPEYGKCKQKRTASEMQMKFIKMQLISKSWTLFHMQRIY